MITHLRNKPRPRIVLVTGVVIATCCGSLGLAAWPASASARACTSATVPPGRVWGSWAYDPATRQVVLFGGDKTDGQRDAGVVYDGTWTWSNGVWTRRHPASSPQPRTGAAIAYDYQTRQLILFGGSRQPGVTGFFSSQTWSWTGSNWVMLRPAHIPPARHNAGLVYDAASHALIMFGGYGGGYLGDTWQWTGSDWVKLSPATPPPARDTHSMAYDKATRSLILWAGYNGVRLNDTWSLPGTDWTRLSPATSPSMDPGPAWQAGYDPKTGQLIVFGGTGPGTAQTWNWNGSDWVRLFPAHSPAWRKYGSISYDGALGELVLFGGFDGSKRPGSVWGWTGSTWRPIGCRA